MKILSLIPKLSSTEFAIYDNGVRTHDGVVQHISSELHSLLTPQEQGRYRFNAMMDFIAAQNFHIDNLDIIITQAGVDALPPGIYLVNSNLIDLMTEKRIDEDVQRSAAFIAADLAEYVNGKYENECLPLLLEPAIDDEIITEAAFSGLRGMTRVPVFHAFSLRAAAALFAWDIGKTPNIAKMIVAHLGTEISVGALDRGRIVDSNSPLDGEGPFSPTTSGTLPIRDLLKLCYSRKYDMDEMLRFINTEGGLAAHLGNVSLQDIQNAFLNGDERTNFIVRAMAYNVAREIGARAAALYGNVDGIILTGPWALFKDFAREIASRVEWIAPVREYVWESELYILMTTAMRIFEGSIKILLYGQDRT